MIHWLALSLSEAPSFPSPHVSLSTWVSHPASLSRSLRRSLLTTFPPQLLLCCCCCRGCVECHASQICLQEGLARFDKWHQYRHAYRASGRRDPPGVDHCRRSQPAQYDYLARSGPQLACGCSNEGSPGALDVERRKRGFAIVQVRPG